MTDAAWSVCLAATLAACVPDAASVSAPGSCPVVAPALVREVDRALVRMRAEGRTDLRLRTHSCRHEGPGCATTWCLIESFDELDGVATFGANLVLPMFAEWVEVSEGPTDATIHGIEACRAETSNCRVEGSIAAALRNARTWCGVKLSSPTAFLAWDPSEPGMLWTFRDYHGADVTVRLSDLDEIDCGPCPSSGIECSTARCTRPASHPCGPQRTSGAAGR